MNMPEYVAVKIMPDKKGKSYNLEVITDADIVPVVRCKDCKHIFCSKQTLECKKPSGVCEYWEDYTELDGFCSYGEKVTENA